MYLKNTSWLLFDRLVRIFGGLFIGIWIARYLGPSDFGVLNYALAYVAFFQVFVNLGLNQIVVRELVFFEDKISLANSRFYKSIDLSNNFATRNIFP